jgi:hypothetical protein
VETFAKTLKSAAELVQRAGPYLLLEILLPGGTLFALLLFVYRNRVASGRSVPFQPGVVKQALANARNAIVFVQPFDIGAVANVDAANDSDGLGPLAMMPARCA